MARLKDENVLRVLHFVEQHEIDEKCYLITEWMDQTLEETLQNADLDIDTATSILTRILKGLHALHNAGIVHRDLKPSNIYLSADGHDVRIADLGIASDVGAEETLTATPKYIAPEIYQAGSEVDRRSDLYSLGMLAYEMFLGRERFAQAFSEILNTDSDRTRNARWLNWHLDSNRKVPPLKELLPGIPEKYSDIVERMMAKDPAARFSSADEILRELGEIHQSNSAAFKPLPIPGGNNQITKRKSWQILLQPRWLALISSLLVALIIAIVFPYSSGDIKLADEAFNAARAAKNKAIEAGAEIPPTINEFDLGVKSGESAADLYNARKYDLCVIDSEKAISLFEQSEQLAWQRRIKIAQSEANDKRELAVAAKAGEPDPVDAYTEAEASISSAGLAAEKQQFAFAEENYIKAGALYISAIDQALQRRAEQFRDASSTAKDRAITAGAESSPILNEFEQALSLQSDAVDLYDKDEYERSATDFEKAISLFEQSEQLAWQRRIEKARTEAVDKQKLAATAKAGEPDPVDAYTEAQTQFTEANSAKDKQQYAVAEEHYIQAGALYISAIVQALQRRVEQARDKASTAQEAVPEEHFSLVEKYSANYIDAGKAWAFAEEQRENKQHMRAIKEYEKSASGYQAALGDIPTLLAWKRMLSTRASAIESDVKTSNPDFILAEQFRQQGLMAFDNHEMQQAEPLFDKATASYQMAIETAKKLAQENLQGKAQLGSTREEIDAAVALCSQYTKDCKREWYASEKLHEVVLKPFIIDETEVSNAQFSEFVNATGHVTDAEQNGSSMHWLHGVSIKVNGYNWKNPLGSGSSYLELPDYPVVHVSQADATAYCSWKNKRLPSEDEWEYSARGKAHRIFPWGDEWNGKYVVWNTGKMSPVKQPQQGKTPEGIINLSGNVWEWTNTFEGNRIVLKGGSWSETNPANLRSAVRRIEDPGTTHSDDGFRCVSDVNSWPER